MLLRKEGLPEVNELVLCTVTSIQYHSVFAELDDYGRQGMIHISEISPGRIRNIRDFVKEGKKIVCKVININQEKGHIDLSLRRVNENQRRQKVSEIKQEQLAENILEFVAKKKGEKLEDVYKKVAPGILESHANLFSAFEEVSTGAESLKDMGVEPGLASEITEIIMQRIKPAELEIGGELKIESRAPDGIELIKEAVRNAGGKADISYTGAGTYAIRVKSLDYKEAEKNLKDFVDSIVGFMTKHGAVAVFTRDEK